jgi:murein hydrolase activator
MRSRFAIFLLTLISVFWISRCLAQSTEREAELKSRLAHVVAAIAGIKKQLVEQQNRQSAAENARREIELAISASAANVVQLQNQLARTQSQLVVLRLNQQVADKALEKSRARLAAVLRSAYAIGRMQQVRLALSQEQLSTVGRVLAYHHYLQRGQLAAITAVRDNVHALKAATAQVNASVIQVQQGQALERRKQAELLAQRAQRDEVLATIAAQMSDAQTQLATLQEDEAQLENLLGQLVDLLADIPKNLPGEKSFAALRGALNLPVDGKLLVPFGARGLDGKPSKGILLGVPNGGPVHNVAYGRVAFADWLRGYGMLMIIDHGDGYMSLYGHCDALLKTEGDWVTAAEVIATAGNTGVGSDSGLYFELRHGRDVLNPGNWLRSR